jgi:hypothetical protein
LKLTIFEIRLWKGSNPRLKNKTDILTTWLSSECFLDTFHEVNFLNSTPQSKIYLSMPKTSFAKPNGTIHLRRNPKSPFVQKSQPWANIYWLSGFPKAGIYMKTFKYAKVFIAKYTWKKNKTKQDEDKGGEADRQRLCA